MKHYLDVRWIRITEEGTKLIREEAGRHTDKKCDALWSRQDCAPATPQWMWFAGSVWDYREACNRQFAIQTWRTRARRILLWLVERLTDV